MSFAERNPRPQIPATALRIDPPSGTTSNVYQELFDKAPIAYMVLCRDGLILEANQAAIVLLGSANESLIGRRLATSFIKDAIDQFEQLLLQARTSDGVMEGRLLFSRCNGAQFWASVTIQRSDDTETRPCFFMTLKDVSSEKAEEQLLRKSIERFQHAIDATRDGIWDWDMLNGSVYFSPQWARLLGYDPGEIPQRVEFFFKVLHPDDVSLVQQELDDHLCGRTPVKQGEVRLQTKTGDYRWFLDRGQVVSRDSSGAPVRMVGTITDITTRKLAEAALRDSQVRTRLLIKAANLGLWDWDLLTNDVYFSQEWKRQLGYDDHEFPNDYSAWNSRLHPDDVDATMAAVQGFLDERRSAYDIEFRLLHKDGSWRWILARADVVRDDTGRPIRMMGCHLDITDRKITEQAIHRSVSLLRATLESTTDGILVVSSEGKFDICNHVFRRMWNIPDNLAEDGIDDVVLEYVIKQIKYPEPFLSKVKHLYEHSTEVSFDTVELLDGRVFERYSCPQLVSGVVAGRAWSFRDVTERVRAEAAQVEAFDRLKKIAGRIPGVVYQFRIRPDGTACFPYASNGMREMFEVDPDDVRENLAAPDNLIDPKGLWQSIKKSAKELTLWVHEFQIRRSDGAVRWLAGNSVPEREPDGSTLWHGVVTDITERREAETKLRESEGRLREAQAISQIGNFHWDSRTHQVTWSDELFRIYGRVPGEFEPSFESYVAAIHADDRERVLSSIQTAMGTKSAFDHQYRASQTDTEACWIRARGVPVLDAAGEVIGLEGTCQDITEQKRAEAVTASLEAQLRESQKMEAIGTLAGGIAHDFNNILTAILGNVEVARPEFSDGSALAQRCLDDIQHAGSRARDLVQQILSFSRRQPTDRKLIRLRPVVEEAERLLRATLPSRISLQVRCDADTPRVMADSTQIEQVLLNLATNAMQAMKGVRGFITITLDSLVLDETLTGTHVGLRKIQQSSGGAVRLTVKDEGPGMDATTLQRIFEPFFTTKPVDEGTGLGLSVVHGIVQSHEGVITVESQPGHGAVFSVYLPAVLVDDRSQTAEAEKAVVPEKPDAAASLQILYLDDDNTVLLLLKRLLERQGHKVTCFAEPREALAALRNAPDFFHLVVTDYNMPGMHGLEVAREIRRIRADLPVAVTSGFIDEELRAGAERNGVSELVAKPFAINELYAAVQRMAQAARRRDV
ncbi:MAG: PAS domain S-box protein [Planctomycetota bacterium]|nr:MAG: PAS domain S-box protein [Planctomycetota bacterium]